MAYPQNSMLENTPLGMYFQGQSIGDEQRKNREASEKHALQYLMDQLTSGDKLNTSHLEGNRAAAMNTPDMLNWHTQGYAGQMKSQDAAGRLAQALYEPNLANQKQELTNKLLTGQIDQGYNEERADKFNTIRNGEYPTGGIGFNMQPPQSQGGTIGFPNNSLRSIRDRLESDGQDYTADGSPMQSPKGALFKNQVMPSTAANPGFGIRPAASQTPEEYNRVGDEYLSALEKKYGGDQEKILAAYNAGPSAIDALVTKYGDKWKDYLPEETKTYLQKAGTSTNLISKFSQPQNNPWLAGVDMQDPRWNAIQGFKMDTPEFRQKMAGMEHKTDAQLEQQELRLQAMKDMQAARKTINEPKYKEQLAAAIQVLSTPNADPAARAKAQMFFNYHQQLVTAAAPANWKQTPDMTQFGIQTNPSAVQQTQATTQPGASATTTPGQRPPLKDF